MRLPPIWLFCAGLCAAANLIPNADFRLDSSGRPSEWRPWSPREALAPEAGVHRTDGGSCLWLRSKEVSSFGKWLGKVEQVEAGQGYRFAVEYRASGTGNEASSVGAILSWMGPRGESIQRDYVDEIGEAGGGWRIATRRMNAPRGAANLTVELFLRWTIGEVLFRRPSLTVAEAPAARSARVAAVRLDLPPSTSLTENIDHVRAALDRAARGHPDFILLGEAFAYRGLPGKPIELAQAIPNALTEALAAKAREHRTYVVTTVYEPEAERVYIAALLFDRTGRIVGKYRKTHLPLSEAEDGITPGNEYPVFETEFGPVGLLVCWDTWFPEPARILRLRGAKLLLVPSAGDGSARHWDAATRARAMDNGMFVAQANTLGPASRIVDPDGEVLAESDDGIALVEVDFQRERRLKWLSVGPGLGEARSLYIRERRPETYGDLLK